MYVTPETGVTIACLAPWVLSPYLAIRWRRWGLLAGVLVFWLVPVAVRHMLIYLGDDRYGGFGLGAHLLTGWLLGLVYCSLVRLAYLRIRSACLAGKEHG